MGDADVQQLKRIVAMRPRTLITLVVLGSAAVLSFISLRNSQARDATHVALLNDGQRVAHTERIGSSSCVSCHGSGGEGNRTLGAPRIAGLSAGYLEKQLRDFARSPLQVGVTLDPIAHDYSKTSRVQVDLTVYTPGVRRHDAMNPAAAALSDNEIHAVAGYFNSPPTMSLRCTVIRKRNWITSPG